MKLFRAGLLLTCGLAFGGLGGCAQQIDFQGIIATAKNKVYPALVFVKPIRETFHSGERTRTEVFGSGVIISPEGYVVTNNHVAEKAIEVNCVLGDREQVSAAVVGLDPETDLALLKLKLPAEHAPLTVAQFGDSDQVQPGQFVMALGSPFGFTRSISLGIISNTERYLGFTTHHQYNLWLQTDAAINPGNSGGPLVNTAGRIIGINTLGAGAEGIGFAIPSNVVREVVDRLQKEAATTPKDRWPVKIDRAYLGLQLQALRDFNTNTFTDSNCGVLIQSVDKDSPADRCGIRDGDILLEVNGQPMDGLYVEDLPHIRLVLADLPRGTPTRLLIARPEVSAGEQAEETAATQPAATSPAGGKSPATTRPATTHPAATRPAKPAATRPAPATAQTAPARPAAARPFPPAAGGNGRRVYDRDTIGDRQVLELTVTPVTRGQFEGADFDCRLWNMTVKEITKFSNPELYFLQPEGGVFIQGVRAEGNAADAGLQVNNIIVKIGDWNIQTIADAKKAYETLTGDKKRTDKKVLVTIKRGAFVDWKMLTWQKDYLQEE